MSIYCTLLSKCRNLDRKPNLPLFSASTKSQFKIKTWQGRTFTTINEKKSNIPNPESLTTRTYASKESLQGRESLKRFSISPLLPILSYSPTLYSTFKNPIFRIKLPSTGTGISKNHMKGYTQRRTRETPPLPPKKLATFTEKPSRSSPVSA